MKQNSTPSLFSHSRSSLSPLLPLLTSFAHRNHNQHRASHWWPSFNILRRSLRTLDNALLAGHDRPIRTQACWMTSHVVPRAYLAFTQLAADNQHAPLGLMLLTVLATVHHLLSNLVPTDLSSKSTAAAKTATLQKAVSASVGEGSDRDMGVTISRHDLAVLSQPKISPPLAEQSASSRIDVSTQKDKRSKQNDGKDPYKHRKKKKSRDELSSLFGSLA